MDRREELKIWWDLIDLSLNDMKNLSFPFKFSLKIIELKCYTAQWVGRARTRISRVIGTQKRKSCWASKLRELDQPGEFYLDDDYGGVAPARAPQDQREGREYQDEQDDEPHVEPQTVPRLLVQIVVGVPAVATPQFLPRGGGRRGVARVEKGRGEAGGRGFEGVVDGGAAVVVTERVMGSVVVGVDGGRARGAGAVGHLVGWGAIVVVARALDVVQLAAGGAGRGRTSAIGAVSDVGIELRLHGRGHGRASLVRDEVLCLSYCEECAYWGSEEREGERRRKGGWAEKVNGR